MAAVKDYRLSVARRSKLRWLSTGSARGRYAIDQTDAAYVVSMAVYYPGGGSERIDIKSFAKADDPDFARREAEELLDTLNG